MTSTIANKYVTVGNLEHYTETFTTNVLNAALNTYAAAFGASLSISGNSLSLVNSTGTTLKTITLPSVSTVDWSSVQNKPTEFTPDTHTHEGSDITSAVANATTSESCTGNATTATTATSANNVKVTHSGAAWRDILAVGDGFTSASNQAVYGINNGSVAYYVDANATSGNQRAILRLGNATANTAAAGHNGVLWIYGTSTGYTQIAPGYNSTGSITVTLPSAAGTLALDTAATTSATGLMSAADKTKLDGIATGANAYTHPTTAGNKHIPSGGSSGQVLAYSAAGTAAWTNVSALATFIKSGSSAAAGLVPKPSTTAGTTKYLREDGTWQVPPDNNTTYSTFVKSGSSAAAGLVPKPSTTAGTTKFLCEDATWKTIPAASLPEADYITTLSKKCYKKNYASSATYGIKESVTYKYYNIFEIKYSSGIRIVIMVMSKNNITDTTATDVASGTIPTHTFAQGAFENYYGMMTHLSGSVLRTIFGDGRSGTWVSAGSSTGNAIWVNGAGQGSVNNFFSSLSGVKFADATDQVCTGMFLIGY